MLEQMNNRPVYNITCYNAHNITGKWKMTDLKARMTWYNITRHNMINRWAIDYRRVVI